MKSVVSKSKNVPDQSIDTKYSNTGPELLDLLKRMLTFNPYTRASAKDLLKSHIFDSIRSEDLEKPSPFKIHLSADTGDKM